MTSMRTLVRTRWAAIGAAVAVTLGAGGFGLADATTSSGERAIYVAIEPCRLVDTRSTSSVGDRTTPIAGGETATFDAWGVAGECDLPAGTAALSLNATAVGATLPTFLQFFPAGTTRPANGSNLNPTPGQPPTPNAVNVTLNDSGEFSVYNLQGSVNLVIDVVGLFDDHTHDDRYAPAESEDGRVVCGPNHFTGPMSNANAKSNSTPINSFCSLDLPTGARIRSISAVYVDQSVGEFGRCIIGSTEFADPLGFTLGETPETTGFGPTPQTLETATISPRVVRDDHHYWFSCRLAPSVSLVAAIVHYDFGSGVIIGPA